MEWSFAKTEVVVVNLAAIGTEASGVKKAEMILISKIFSVGR